jgi:Protein of unknown function (DUF2726)
MSTTSNIVTLLAIAAAVVVSLAILKAKRASKGDANATDQFKAKRLLSANEIEFIGRMESACPELRFHAQVSMGAILDPAVPSIDRKAFMRIRGQFSQKIIDFVAQDRQSGEIVAIIELDDRTHKAEKDNKRDAMLKSAGYRTIRWESKNKPNAAVIRAELFGAQRVLLTPTERIQTSPT